MEALQLGFQVLPAIGALSVCSWFASSGSSRMSRAPNLHLVTQLLILTWNGIFIYKGDLALILQPIMILFNHNTKKLVLLVTASITASHPAVSSLKAFDFILLVQ